MTITERHLALLEAIRRGSGLTRSQIREQLPYYEGLSDAAFHKAFDRDIATLRQSGYPIVVDRAYRYSYDAAAPLIAPVSSADLGLLRSAISGIGRTGREALVAHNGLQKLLAASEAHTDARYVRATIPEGSDAPAIARALQYGRCVEFDYVGTSSAATHHYVLCPREIDVHFDAFYVKGPAQRDGKPWATRSFKVARIVPGTLTVGEALQPDEDHTEHTQTHDAFVEDEAILAIRPGTAVPLAQRGERINDGEWPQYRFRKVNRQRMFDELVTYGVDVHVVGSPSFLAQWRERVEHVARLARQSPSDTPVNQAAGGEPC
ncbi:MAG: WYL domain-containing protein [Ancrocorticia sp.]|nr:WYL domain-containing protein [Ancrocorticia sp.]